MRRRSSVADGPVRTIAIDSWDQFLEIASGPEFKSWAFRGQSEDRWPLYTSISRYLLAHGVHRDAWVEQEQRIVRIFRRKAHLFLEHIPEENDSFQWLALMQHHGAPTRLLDFTWSPYVAAFFALESATTDCAIWGVFPPRISATEQPVKIRGGRVVRPTEIGPWTPGNYETHFLPGTLPVVVVGEPRIMNRRLVAQAGTFVMPGVLDEPIDTIVSSYAGSDAKVVKFVVRTRDVRKTAMRELYNMNITPASLFPDLDGLARSMAYELEFHWAYDPTTMERFPGYGAKIVDNRASRQPLGSSSPPAS
jgi:FRG domain